MDIDDVAECCHEATRAIQRALGEPISPAWSDTDAETRESARDGVRNALSGTTPEDSHANWVAYKVAHGWAYGETKDHTNKTHPCLVPYTDLPEEQRMKDRVFLTIVDGLYDRLNR